MEVTVQTISVPGRVLASVRGTQIAVDATKTRGGPGEAPTSVEVFLAGLLACGALIVETQARDHNIPLKKATFHVDAEYTKAIFSHINIRAKLEGVSRSQAEQLIGVYTSECPIFRLASLGAPTTLTLEEPKAA